MRKKLLSEVCSDTGVSRRAIQGYEKAGLITPSGKNKYGYLLYDSTTEDRIREIRFYQEIGFSIREISEFIDSPGPVQKEILQRKADELDCQLKQKKELLQKLTEQIRKL